MSLVVGYAGTDFRSDVKITVAPSSSFGYEFVSHCSPLYDDSIRNQIELVAQQYDRPPIHLECIDSGALPMVWEARLTAAFCLFLGAPIPRMVSDKRYGSSGIRRSRLYVPANTPKLIPNAKLFRPDAVILDLEESVHADRKIEALAMAAVASEHLDWQGVELMIRVNSGTQGELELTTLAQSAVATFILPKVNCREDVLRAAEVLDSYRSEAALIPLIESAYGVENAFDIASCTNRITAISLGLEDYVSDIGAVRTAEQSESAYARSRVLNAARAAGIMPLASVVPGYQQLGEVEEYANQARRSGYEGVGCIHPNQIEAVHNGFRASQEELLRAHQVVEAYESAEKSGGGVVGVGGSMADLPTFLRAKRLIEYSEGGAIQ